MSSVRLLYDRSDRSQGTAFVIYENHRHAQAAITQFDGANANGQPIRLTLLPSAPAAAPSRGTLFDRIERPARSLFDRIDSGPVSRDDSREGSRPRRRRRSMSPVRLSDTSRPAPENIDRYVPGQRSPARRPRENGRRPGARREESGRGGRGREAGGRPVVQGRPRKTAEELDAEMNDYFGGNQEEKPKENGSQNGTAAPVASSIDQDIDMIE